MSDVKTAAMRRYRDLQERLAEVVGDQRDDLEAIVLDTMQRVWVELTPNEQRALHRHGALAHHLHRQKACSCPEILRPLMEGPCPIHG